MAITGEFGCIKCGYTLSATSPDDINIEIHRSEPVVSSIEMEIPCINSHVDILINFGGVSLNYIISINRYFL